MQTRLECIREKLRNNMFLVGILVTSLFLRMLWLTTLIQRDEGAQAYCGMLWLEGYLPYVHTLDNKGPIQYLLYMISTYFFDGNIIPIRMLNNILFLISLVVLYLIVKSWYDKRTGVFVAFFYGIFMNVPIFEAHSAITEPVSVPLVIFSIYFLDLYIKSNERKMLLASGISISLASLIRLSQAVGFLLLLAIIGFTRYQSLRQRPQVKLSFFRDLTSDILLLSAGVLVPVLIVVTYFWVHGAFNEFIEVLIYRLFSHYFVEDVPFGIKFLIAIQGLPLWLFSILGCIVCFTRRNRYDMFTVAWMLFFLPIVLTPPTFGHHFTQILAAASILSGVGLVSALNSRSESLMHLFRNYRQDMARIFIVVILLISFAPSIYFQSIQYPNFNIQWEFIEWNYADSISYGQQMKLGNYLKHNTLENESILVHAWSAEIYWLSGHVAPSKWVWTVKNPKRRELGIPEEEYQRIVSDVRCGKFKYIVFFDSNLRSLESRLSDPVVNSTFRRYFLHEQIGNAFVFSKYDKEGRYVSYLFIDNFFGAVKEFDLTNGTVIPAESYPNVRSYEIPALLRISISNETRDAIRQVPLTHLTSRILYHDVFIPPNSTLKFGIGIGPWTWTRKGGDGTQFEIYVNDGTEIGQIFGEYINPKQNVNHRKWNEFEIDLSRYGGKNVSIVFVTSPGPAKDNFDDWAYWSNPVILTKQN